jgi:hypothetical protein
MGDTTESAGGVALPSDVAHSTTAATITLRMVLRRLARSGVLLRTVLVSAMHSLRTRASICTGPAFRLLPILAVAKLGQVRVSHGSSSD